MISVTSARRLEIWNHLKAYLLSADAGCWLGIQLELSARTPIYGVTLWSGLPHNMMAGIQDQASQQRELSGNCLLWPVSRSHAIVCAAFYWLRQLQISVQMQHTNLTSQWKKCHHYMVRTCGMGNLLLQLSIYIKYATRKETWSISCCQNFSFLSLF